MGHLTYNDEKDRVNKNKNTEFCIDCMKGINKDGFVEIMGGKPEFTKIEPQVYFDGNGIVHLYLVVEGINNDIRLCDMISD